MHESSVPVIVGAVSGPTSLVVLLVVPGRRAQAEELRRLQTEGRRLLPRGAEDLAMRLGPVDVDLDPRLPLTELAPRVPARDRGLRMDRAIPGNPVDHTRSPNIVVCGHGTFPCREVCCGVLPCGQANAHP